MEYKCGNCREVSRLSPKAKFCPFCGSSSLILVVKEQAEPHQKETVGVYNTATINDSESVLAALKETITEEEDQPRHKH